MGTMEKAGIAVIAVLIGIIVVVGIMNKKDADPGETPKGSRPGNESQDKSEVRPAPSPGVIGKSGEDKAPKVGEVGKTENSPAVGNGTSAESIDPRGAKKIEFEDGAKETPAPGTTVSGFPRSYAPKKGDTPVKIAFREYGTEKMAPIILAENKVEATGLKIGVPITLPAPPADLLATVAEAQAKNAVKPADAVKKDGTAAKTPTAKTPVAKSGSKAPAKAPAKTSSSGRPSFLSATYRANNLGTGKTTKKSTKK
jgi:hypothetical protein